MTTKKPKYYKPGPGDEFVKLRDLSSKHVGRIFEARNQRNGEGILGELEDANFYLLQDTVGIRFKDEPLGLFDTPDAVLLLKPEGFTLPDVDDPGVENG